MSQLMSAENLSNIDATSTDEQPRKYLRQNTDTSVGVTTRARQREQDKQKQTSESIETMSNDQTPTNSISSVRPVEQCAICMENLTTQEVGIPENCEHNFCLACLIEWAKKNNSCPIDRIVFRRILKKYSIAHAKPYDSMEVEDNRLRVQLEDDFLEMINDDLSCRVCGRGDQDELLLICDECGNGYHTFCLELPGVPNTPEWMCPLCEVDQLSADENLYDDSDLEELQQILFDDTFNASGSDTEMTDLVAPVRQTRIRQTARMRTGGTRQRRAASPTTRPARRQRRLRSRRRQRRRAPTRRQPTLVEQQRQRQRRQVTAHNAVNRRIENVNAITRDGSIVGNASRNDAPRVSIYDAEPIAFEDEPSSSSTHLSTSNRAIITPSEAARRIAASGIPILSRSQTEPSISRELSIRRLTPTLDRVPSRTIRPPRIPPPPPTTQRRISISQLPRIQRRADAPARPSQPAPVPTPVTRTLTTVPLTNASFLDDLLNSQQRLHNLENVRMHGPHIEIS